ncbi:MAG: hypothetical protein ACRDOK_11415 [Streptosporangiaceae bacterium]
MGFQTDTEALELLRVLGQVDPPAATVLAAARESLRSAVTDELLAGHATQVERHEARQSGPRRRPGQAHPENRQRHVPPAPG